MYVLYVREGCARLTHRSNVLMIDGSKTASLVEKAFIYS